MTAAPPSAVLSESFQKHLEGRRVRTAVFFTFSFDPAFFEQDILPVFLDDIPLSQDAIVRLMQLEDELRSRLEHVAVYYDPRGLVASTQAPRLDVRRVPVAMRGGFFHPKNIFVITEPVDPEAPQSRTLIVATLSANLTKAGWWQSVECCHIETVEEASALGFRDDLLGLFRAVRAACSDAISHDPLEQVRRFIADCTQRDRISDNRLPARIFGGRDDFVQFLANATRGRLEGLNLEVIAPYVDDSEAKPLQALIEAFEPRECRVFLPRTNNGSIACSESYYDAVRRMVPACWGQLPKSILQMGKTEQAADRFVHAKVYRFFHPSKRYEAIVVGSINLTGAAHGRGGNLESAFLVEPELNQVPDWWLSRMDGKRPAVFQDVGEDDDVTTGSPAAWLTVTYHWNDRRAEVEWRGEGKSAAINLSAAGVHRLRLDAMDAGEHRSLSEADAEAIRAGLDTTALFTASVEGAEDGPLLVREEGMSWKPSILLTLSVADILRYWSALTSEQRLAVLENVARSDPALAGGLTLPKRSSKGQSDSFFDNFAQIFQAFENVEQAVSRAIEAERESEAVQRLLGEKYDSLPCMLRRVSQPDNQLAPVSRYLIVLCARQVLEQVRRTHPQFARSYRGRFEELLGLADTSEIRRQLNLAAVEKPDAFLDWFEMWFVRRAKFAQELT